MTTPGLRPTRLGRLAPWARWAVLAGLLIHEKHLFQYGLHIDCMYGLGSLWAGLLMGYLWTGLLIGWAPNDELGSPWNGLPLEWIPRSANFKTVLDCPILAACIAKQQSGEGARRASPLLDSN